MTVFNRALDTDGGSPAKNILSFVVGALRDRLFLAVAPAASQMAGVNAALTLLASSATYTEASNDRFDGALGPFLFSRAAYLAFVSSASTLVVEQADASGGPWTDCPGSPFTVPANTTFDTNWIPISQRFWRARLTNNGATYTFARLYLRMGAHPDQVSALQPRGVKRTPITPVVLPATTATLIVPANPRRTLVKLRNVGPGRVYLGGSNLVTADSPDYLEADDPQWDDDSHDAIWGYADASGATMKAMEIDVA